MLEIKKLSAEIEGIRVLRDVTVQLNSGSTVALVGRNGAGKTSLLRSIMGFMKVISGDIVLNGKSLQGVAPHMRPSLGIGYAPEDRRLYGSFTLEQNILLPGEVLKLDRTELRRRLDGVYHVLPELKDLRTRPAGGLSGGQGKMVALGRALMVGTKVILLDEPFQGLAPVLAARYAAALRALRETNRDVALLITESNPSLLHQMADSAYLIERGEVIQVDALPRSSIETERFLEKAG